MVSAATIPLASAAVFKPSMLSQLRLTFVGASTDEDFAPYRIALASTARLPPVPVQKRATGTALGVFASVAISAARLPSTAKWKAVGDRDYTALFGSQCTAAGLSNCDSRFATRLRTATSAARGLATPRLLALVNREVNLAMAYQPDSRNWGTGDYWANPVEIARKGAGDCEDFAVAKFWMLRALGVPAERLQIVVLSDVKRQVYHAVLVVHDGGKSYVLDNLSETVRADTAYPNYVPIMSFVGDKSYIHGFESRTTAVAFSGDLGAVQPGEGI
ncbi:MAG TPA: transglutaminase-like cysteine peptidase [Devosia sp.]|nr:transglutaminase-like cysteine peptidase [Devosia sp.]